MNFLLKKIKSRVENLTDKQKNDINRLYDDHRNKKTNIHSSISTLTKQIELGLEDLYERHYLIKKELKPKDSSSLHSFIIRYGEQSGHIMFNEKIKRTSITLEKYIEKYGEIEGSIKYKDYCISKGSSLEGFIARHGEKDGPKKHKEYWETTLFTTNKDRIINRLGDKAGEQKYKEITEKIAFANTLKGYEQRYGDEEGKKRYTEGNKRKSRSQSKEAMVENMLADGKSIDDVLLAVEDRWSRSLKTYQRKFGDEEGEKRYEEFNIKLRRSNPICIEYYEHRNIPEKIAFELISDIQVIRNSRNNFYSKESMIAMLPVVLEVERITKSKLFYADNEFFIRLRKEENDISQKRLLFYDFTFPDLGIIIEYHGEFYHDDINYDATKNMEFSDFLKNYNSDQFKKWIAETRGYEVFVVRSWNKRTDLMNLRNFLCERGIEVCEAKFI